VKRADDDHVLILSAHHIVCDGWSFGVLLRDLAAAYGAACRDGNAASAFAGWPPAVRFRDYARTLAEAPEAEKTVTEAYWLERLSNPLPPALELPTDRPRPSVKTFGGRRRSRTLPAPLYEALKQASARQGCTLFVTLLGAYAALLGRLTGQDDLVVGVPAAGQAVYDGGGDLVGHGVHLLPVRLAARNDQPFAAHLAATRSAMLDAYDHQGVTYGSLLPKLPELSREPGRAPLVATSFNIDGAAAVAFDGLGVRVAKNPRAFFQFDLGVNLVEEDGRLDVECNFNTDLFDEETIDRWLGHYETLLAGVVAAAPDSRLADLPILTDAERHQLLVAWNDTGTDYPREASVHSLFEEQAARTPDAVALALGDETLSYADLNARANRLARCLRRRGVGPGANVGVCVERSFEMIVGLLAVLKAGGAYVPLDPAYPAERLALMADDAGVALVLTQKRLAEDGRLGARPRLLLDGDADLWATESPENPDGTVAAADSPAYVIYTSGSTGRPKGTEIPHRGVVRLVRDTNYVRLGPDEVFLQHASLAFDASTFEIWAPLLNGGRLAILPPGTPSLAELGRAIRRHGSRRCG
jgi:non-ribosomal peptide synthetase component F